MPATLEEIVDFHDFAVQQLSNGGVNQSLEELLIRWRAHCVARAAGERGDVDGAICRGLMEADAGLGRSLDEFMDEFRQRHNISAEA